MAPSRALRNTDADTATTARRVRQRIATLLDIPSPERIVLAPGILIALRLILDGLGVRTLLLSKGEYYSVKHFPGPRFAASQCSPAGMATEIARVRVDAILRSVVTWYGSLPTGELPEHHQFALPSGRTLSIVDYSHGGAIGFPSVKELGGDIVCGDLEKWITPLASPLRLSFLWCRQRQHFETARRALFGFFLATDSGQGSRYARWIDPRELAFVESYMRAEVPTRAMLLRRHENNVRFANSIRRRLGLPTSAQRTSIVWLPPHTKPKDSIEDLERAGLVWRTRGGYRILCRADEYAAAAT